jgi:tellurite resistance protein
LYFLANQDGIDQNEENLIKEFLEEAGSDLKFEEMKSEDFSAVEAAQMLETTYLRRIFLKAAIALVKADGVYSDKEREALGKFADAFGLSNAEFGLIEQEANDLRIE